MDTGIYDILSNAMLAMITGYVFYVIVHTFAWSARKVRSTSFDVSFYFLIVLLQLAQRFALRGFFTGLSLTTYLDPLLLFIQWLMLCRLFDTGAGKAAVLVLSNYLGYMASFSAVSRVMYRLHGIPMSGIFPFYARLMHEMALMAIVILVFYLFVVLLAIIWRTRYQPPASLGYTVGITLPTILFLAGYITVYPYMENIDNNNTALLTGILLFAVNVAAWIVSTELDSRNVRMYYMNLHYQEKLEYFARISEDKSYVMKRIHDERKHLNHMLGLLQNAQYERLNNYLHSMSSGLVDVGSSTITGNLEVDIVLNAKIADAENAGCSISVSGILPSRINIDPIDSCILLGNCLDNAITACLPTDDHVIDVQFKSLRSFLIVKVKNRYSKSGKQSKTGKQNKIPLSGLISGQGLEIVRAVAEKYDGKVNIEQQNSTFAIEIFLRNR